MVANVTTSKPLRFMDGLLVCEPAAASCGDLGVK
jgi:hypothetical protein